MQDNIQIPKKRLALPLINNGRDCNDLERALGEKSPEGTTNIFTKLV